MVSGVVYSSIQASIQVQSDPTQRVLSPRTHSHTAVRTTSLSKTLWKVVVIRRGPWGGGVREDG